MKSATGRDAENILFGSTLAGDRHGGKRFDYLLANPPYGKDWKRDKDAVEAEATKGEQGRFVAGTPRISDGQLLFLQHMLSRMKPPEQGGSRVAIIMNGSPLFTGDAASGESEIRRWILENDWLEALIALPEQLFYNTGIATYVWVLTNRKAKKRKGKVQLINATDIWSPMRRSLGDKRREISDAQRGEIVALHAGCKEGERVKLFDTAAFGYRKITVERPLRLNFLASSERIARLDQEGAFKALAVSKKKNPKQRAAEEAAGRKEQEAIKTVLAGLPPRVFKDRVAFEVALTKAVKVSGARITALVKKAILAALSERDEAAEVCPDADGKPEPDPELRDYENVPLGESIQEFFDCEVKPYVPDSWINLAVVDEKDQQVGKVGYEINFNRYFYKYVPPRPLEEIEKDIAEVEKAVLEGLREVVK